jgi:VIT1/CCC1 family predicted Fe2+/Mn2+ transporter
LGNDPEGEVEELANIYAKKGLDRALAHSVAESLMRDPEVALDTHAREELGIDPNEGLGSPVGAAGSSFLTFSLGALVPLIPFLFVVGQTGAVWSAILAALALFAVGASAAALTGKSWVLSGLRMLGIGAAAAAVTYAVGRLLDVTVVG